MMKSIGICYSEQAIKVSNSHSRISSQSDHQVSITSTNLNNNIIQYSNRHASTCNYKVKLSNGTHLLIKLTWRKSSLSDGKFSISVSDFPILPLKNGENVPIFLKHVRGTKNIELCNLKIEVYWDFSRAEYESGPEPVKGYYVVILVNSELVLLLGDVDRELEVKNRISNVTISSEFELISRREFFKGNDVCSTRAKFCDKGTCHDILIKCGGEKGTNSMLDVYVDKKRVVEVRRLKWNFRGNQTIFLDGLLVDLMWDLYDWFFGCLSSGYGVFLFRTRSGLDSRLWLEEKINDQNEDNKVGFSLLICACKNPD